MRTGRHGKLTEIARRLSGAAAHVEPDPEKGTVFRKDLSPELSTADHASELRRRIVAGTVRLAEKSPKPNPPTARSYQFLTANGPITCRPAATSIGSESAVCMADFAVSAALPAGARPLFFAPPYSRRRDRRYEQKTPAARQSPRPAHIADTQRQKAAAHRKISAMNTARPPLPPADVYAKAVPVLSFKSVIMR